MEIHFEIENNCILNCRHCSSWATANGENKNYSVQDIINFLKGYNEEKIIFFTGGEPLLHLELKNMLREISLNVSNCSFGLFTTGIKNENDKLNAITLEEAKQLKEYGLKIVYLSIYSNKELEHDWMTNTQGSFSLTKQAVINFKEAGIETRFNSVVTKRNINSFSEIINLGKLWGVSEIRLLKLIKHGRAKECWDEIGITEDEYIKLVREVHRWSRNIRITVSGCVEGHSCRPIKNPGYCIAGELLFYVTYKGYIYPCASAKNNINFMIGKLENCNLMELYESNLDNRQAFYCRG